MKTKIFIGAALATSLGLLSCKDSPKARFLDLNTGENIELRQDGSGAMINAETGKPVDIYVDTKTGDTIYGRTGKVINGKLVKNRQGEYAYTAWEVKQDGEEYKAKAGDAKIKSEGDEHKVKNGSYTRKVEGDGDVKIETGSKQIKIDGKTGRKKVKKDRNITDKVKKIFD